MKKNKGADTKKFFLKNLPKFLAYVNSKQILPMVLLLGGGYVFTLLPSLLGPIALFVLYALAFKLAVDVLVETANGNMLPGDYQSSFEAKNILIQFVIVGLLQTGMLIWLKYFVLDSLLIITYIIVSTFITPAVFMVLSITSSLSSALNPLIIIKLIKPWFFTYLIFVVFWLFEEMLLTFIIDPFTAKLPSLFGGVVSHLIKFYVLILNFHIMGFLIFQHRHSFGFDAKIDRNSDSLDSLSREEPNENPIYVRIKSLIAMGDFNQAKAIIAEMRKESDTSEELSKIENLLRDKLGQKEIKHRSNAEKIHQFIKENRPGKAFQVYQQMLLNQEKFNAIDATDITNLVHSAYQAQRFSQVVNLLKFFHNKYPNHEDIVPNYFLMVQVLFQNEKTKEQAKTLLDKLIKKYPNHKLIPQLESWRKGIKLMN